MECRQQKRGMWLTTFLENVEFQSREQSWETTLTQSHKYLKPCLNLIQCQGTEALLHRAARHTGGPVTFKEKCLRWMKDAGEAAQVLSSSCSMWSRNEEKQGHTHHHASTARCPWARTQCQQESLHVSRQPPTYANRSHRKPEVKRTRIFFQQNCEAILQNMIFR